MEDWEEPGAGGAPGSSQCWEDPSVKVRRSGGQRRGGTLVAVVDHLQAGGLDAVYVDLGDRQTGPEFSRSTVGLAGDGSGGGADG